MKILLRLLVIILFVTYGCEQSRMPVEVQNSEPTTINSLAKASTVPGDYVTIQEAVDAAMDGDIIIIKEGVYKELVKIYFKSNVTLIGENALISPPDDIDNGEGIFNIEVLESSNIILENLNFDGKVDEERVYPIDRAIAFNSSSGEVSKCNFEGYGLGIATFNVPPTPEPNSDLISIKILNNKFENCYGQMEISGNYNYVIEHNIINYFFEHSRLFDHFFPHWYGILVEGGTGTISKNLIKFKSGSIFLVFSGGIRLMKRDPAAQLAGLMNDLQEVDVTKNIIKGSGIGIVVNSNESFYDEFGNVLDEEWCVHGVSLQNNTFVHVEEEYEIYNDCEPVNIEP